MNLATLVSRFNPADLGAVIVTIMGSVQSKPWEFVDESGAKRTGTSYTQPAKLEVGGFAYPFKVKLEDPNRPYSAGEYILDLASLITVQKEVLYLGKFHRLIPLAEAKPARVAAAG